MRSGTAEKVWLLQYDPTLFTNLNVRAVTLCMLVVLADISKTRISEHLGVYGRTGNVLSSQPHSSIRAHSVDNIHPVSYDDFSVFASSNTNRRARTVDQREAILYLFY